jgi:hypothetical protein
MVGFGVASYTGIIERGIEQQRGAKSMTTKQNPNVSMLDEDLDQVPGGLIAIIAIAAGRPVATRRLGGQEGEPVIQRQSSVHGYPCHVQAYETDAHDVIW